jgi:hypothetical protein
VPSSGLSNPFQSRFSLLSGLRNVLGSYHDWPDGNLRQRNPTIARVSRTLPLSGSRIKQVCFE